MSTMRICFVGDSIIVGSGDTNFLGWPGRLSINETNQGHDITLYNMGVRGDTSEMVSARWRKECEVRLPEHVNGKLVMSFGLNDTAEESNVGIRVPIKQTIYNLKNTLTEASQWLPTLVIGPVPIINDMQPYIFPNGIAYHYSNDRIAELNILTSSICSDLNISYLNIFDYLSNNPSWANSQRECDGVHATGNGYKILSERVSNWPAWRKWFS
ncbi:MAG: lipase [Rhodospirillaceae bacterium]|nr:lipase [Rhodospirillaceae bacterium]